MAAGKSRQDRRRAGRQVQEAQMKITGQQVKAARLLLGWTQSELGGQAVIRRGHLTPPPPNISEACDADRLRDPRPNHTPNAGQSFELVQTRGIEPHLKSINLQE